MSGDVGLPDIKTPQHWDDWCIGFDGSGHLVTVGHHGHREPVCPECGEPIRWVLDMMSFKLYDGMRFAACHARCVWMPEAFDRERSRTPDQPAT